MKENSCVSKIEDACFVAFCCINGAAQLPGNIIWLALNTVTCGTVSETVVASCCCRDEYCLCCATEKAGTIVFMTAVRVKT